MAAPYSTEAADAAADAELGLSQDGLVDLARETGDEVGYAEGLRTANDALGTSYTVAEMRREGSRRASRLAPGPAPGPPGRADRRPGRHANRRPRWATESARSRALESSPPRRRSDETSVCDRWP